MALPTHRDTLPNGPLTDCLYSCLAWCLLKALFLHLGDISLLGATEKALGFVGVSIIVVLGSTPNGAGTLA